MYYLLGIAFGLIGVIFIELNNKINRLNKELDSMRNREKIFGKDKTSRKVFDDEWIEKVNIKGERI